MTEYEIETIPFKVYVDIEDFKRLKRDSDFLDCLRYVGVDNWSGYPEAVEQFEKYYKEEN